MVMNEGRKYGAGVPGNVQAKMGTPQENPRVRAAREAQEAQARAAQERRAELEVQDPWEARRQEFANRGDIFDVKGNVTRRGEEILRAAGWNTNQILYIENLQRNHVGNVEVVPQEASSDQGKTSSTERARMAQEARARAMQELQKRQQEVAESLRRDQEQRSEEGKRRAAGVRAYMNTLHATGSESMAEQARSRAERDFDFGIRG